MEKKRLEDKILELKGILAQYAKLNFSGHINQLHSEAHHLKSPPQSALSPFGSSLKKKQ
jgi:hypothetical protein